MLKKILLLAVLLTASWLSANDYGLVNNHANLANQLIFAQNTGENSDGSESTGTVSAKKKKRAKMKDYRDGKSPLIASGLSLLIPGAGEIYGEDYLMGGIFLGVEAGLWTGYLVYENDGDSKTKDYRNFADNNFDYKRYYQAIWQMISTIPEGNLDTIGFRPTYDQLTAMSSDGGDLTWIQATKYLNRFIKDSWTGTTEFTHQLPTRYNSNTDKNELDKTQQYYEMIGKYHQFAAGWNDFTGWTRVPVSGHPGEYRDSLITGKNYQNNDLYESKNRLDIYENMRDEANQAYEVAQNFLMIAVLNRVVSAFDASYVIKRDFTINTALRFENNSHQPGPISADNYKMTLNFSW